MPDRSLPLLLRHARNDLARNRGVSLTLFAILLFGAFLMATGTAVVERLVGSVDQLFEQARPPHFLQMHTGDYDAAALRSFAAGQPGIEAWTIVELYGFDGAALGWQRPATGESGDFSDSLIDNLFVAQNPDFDFLIDQTGAIAAPAPGEVYVPVAYQRRFGLLAGDQLTVGVGADARQLRVAGFVRDAQMASSLSSATRFLVSPDELRALGATGGGAAEIIVEYRLHDPADLDELQRAYQADDTLPKNGQAVTGDMIRIVNVFSDGLVAAALIFASLVLVAIAVLSLQFVIRGALQAQVREIGVMKAIGIPHRQIIQLYLAGYAVLTLAACLVGGLLGPPAAGLLTSELRSHYAAAPAGPWTVLAPVTALAALFTMVMLICAGVLRGVRRIEVTTALVHGSTLTERQLARQAKRAARGVRADRWRSATGRAVNRSLVLLELRSQWRQWVLLPIVLFLAAIVMVVPMNLLSTFESPRIGSYLGAPPSDLRADLRFSDDLDGTRSELLARMRDDPRLTDVRPYAEVVAGLNGPDGPETLRVEVGDYSGGTVEFTTGRAPLNAEIALSELNAERHRVGVGDRLRLRIAGQWAERRVSGIYADVTSGGYTAKLPGEITEGASGYVIYADLAEGADPAATASEYNARFPSAIVIPMEEYLRQTLEHVTGAFRAASAVTLFAGLGVAALLTSLVLGLHLAQHRRWMGTLSAIGFSAREITAQVRAKVMLAVVMGTGIGALAAALLGDAVAGALIGMAGLGISGFSVDPVSWLVYGVYPSALLGAGWLGAVLSTTRLRRADPSDWLE